MLVTEALGEQDGELLYKGELQWNSGEGGGILQKVGQVLGGEAMEGWTQACKANLRIEGLL